ncbi:MAG: hypothetical protein RLZZ323_525 [Bacteroidota bacterium]|jgi:hypothetical protein
MNTAKYILKKTKLMNPRYKQTTRKKQYSKPSNTNMSNTHLDDTYFLLAQMYAQENDPLFI